MESIHWIDLSIFLIYFLLLGFIGFRAGRKSSDGSVADFFIGSGTLPWYAIGFSMIAAGISSEHFLGAVGYSYNYGLAVANWEWLNGPSLVILVLIFIPFYLRKKIVTMPQFLELRFDRKTRQLFAIVTIIIYIFINLAGVVYSGGIALKAIFGFESVYPGIWMVVVTGGAFAVYGGMESVAWTNVFQSIMLLGGGLLVFVLGLITVPGGWEGIMQAGENNHLILPADHPEIPWPALIVLMLSTNVWFFCTNQSINQSTLSAKNEWHAKMGILFVGFLGIIIPLADVFPGLIARALDLNISDASGNTDGAYINVVNFLVPVGLRGIVYAGLCGAIISTVEALVNACSTVFTLDIYKTWSGAKPDNQKLIKIGRWCGIIVIIISALWSPMVGTFDHIFEYFQQCWAFIASPMVVVFLLAVLWKNYSNRAAFLTLLMVFPMFAMPYFLQITHISTNAFIVAGYASVIILILSIVLSFATPASISEDAESFVWKKSMIFLPKSIRQKYVGYRSITLWIVILLLSYALLYAWLW